MSRTTRRTHFEKMSRVRIDRWVEWHIIDGVAYAGNRQKLLERHALFNGRDNHKGEICGAGTNSPKGKDAWGEYWGRDKRGVKRATAKIIRRRGRARIREEVIDFHGDNNKNR